MTLLRYIHLLVYASYCVKLYQHKYSFTPISFHSIKCIVMRIFPWNWFPNYYHARLAVFVFKGEKPTISCYAPKRVNTNYPFNSTIKCFKWSYVERSSKTTAPWTGPSCSLQPIKNQLLFAFWKILCHRVDCCFNISSFLVLQSLIILNRSIIFVKKAKQRLYFLRRLRSFGLTTQIMLTFYRARI